MTFEVVCGPKPQAVYPFARRAIDEDLIRDLRYYAWPLEDWQMQILEDAGAYLPIREYARNCLVEADEILESLTGSLLESISKRLKRHQSRSTAF
jgi:hypothetical protein